MRYKFEFCPYRRRFVRPLFTNHGKWDFRDGIILRLSDENGQVYYGEIAPLSWFGSETLAQALDFCSQLPAEITTENIFAIPDSLPACQFGFESACESLQTRDSQQNPPSTSLTYSGLLAAGETALNQWQTLWEQGVSTFKWKIGVYSVAEELAHFKLLTQKLPASAKLRLDANGGLSYDDAHLWLRNCDNIRATTELEIEFIEQPLAVEQFKAMLELSNYYNTAIALDESVATITQLAACYHQGWRDVFVIKPAIAGSPSHLRDFCHKYQINAVFSSVFETEIGRQAALKLATELSNPYRAVGFGINHWFDENDNTWIESLWNQ